MDYNDTSHTASPETVTYTEQTLTHITGIRKWAHFFAILGFIFIGLMVLVSLFIGSVFSTLTSQPLPFSPYLVGGLYLIIALIYYFPVRYLYRFASMAKKGIANRNNGQLEEAFSSMKAHYAFIGYITVAILLIYAVILSIVFLLALIS